MSTATLKVIATICMLLDHIAGYFHTAPVWFHWIGRISAPLFMFCLAWGMVYTHDRKKYLLRLYIASVSMSILNYFADSFFGTNIESNIFAVMFSAALLIYIIDYVRQNKTERKKILVIYAAVQLLEIVFIGIILPILPHFGYMEQNVFIALSGNLFLHNEGFIFLILPVLIYYNGYTKEKLAVTYIFWWMAQVVLCVSGLPYRLLRGIPEGIAKDLIEFSCRIVLRLNPLDSLRRIDYRVLVICALPFMLMYNNKRGRYNKYFFYLFYPAHIYILYFMSKYL